MSVIILAKGMNTSRYFRFLAVTVGKLQRISIPVGYRAPSKVRMVRTGPDQEEAASVVALLCRFPAVPGLSLIPKLWSFWYRLRLAEQRMRRILITECPLPGGCESG